MFDLSWQIVIVIVWDVFFQTMRPVGELPRVLEVSSETVCDPAFRHYGKFRRAERHCVFKQTLSGEGIFADADGEHRVPAGRGFLCEIYDLQMAYYYPPAGREPWTFVYMDFEGDDARRLVRELVKRHGPIYALPPSHPAIRRLLECSADDGRTRRVTPAWGAGLVMDVLLALLASKETRRREAPEHPVIRRARDLVAQSQSEPLNATELARRLSVSREYLSRKFREQLALSPHEYILRHKLLCACRWLKETTLSNKEIAARLGYDAAGFSRTFRHVFQMPPRRFRAVGAIPVWGRRMR